MQRKVSVAPMMDCTDRHERYFLRLISKNTLLYTEMIVSEAIDRGDKKKLLAFNINEKPLALQLGGSSPKLLANDENQKNIDAAAKPVATNPKIKIKESKSFIELLVTVVNLIFITIMLIFP